MTKSIAVLMRNLRDANPEVRSRAAMDLGENKAEEALSSLARTLLTDDEPSVRSVAAEALGTIANPSVIPELTRALEEETNKKVLFSVNWALEAIAKNVGKDLQELIIEYENKRSEVIDRSVKSSSTASEEELEDFSETTHAKRLELLERIMKRYESLSLEKMAQLLRFSKSIQLEEWLLELPDELAFRIIKDEVYMPEILRENSQEAKISLKKLLTSFEEYLSKN